MLRKWQSECADNAITFYKNQYKHFLCQATPGAGKTVLAAEIAKRLLDEDKIDLVLCFSPSLSVAEGIKDTFSWKLNCAFNGGLGAIGASFTYQSLAYFPDSFWLMLKRKRLFVIFDEIHHCAGDMPESSNSWGEHVLVKLQHVADYTLALTGTPWRTDKAPIVMTEYSDPEGQIVCNYQYTLKQAVQDGVCRIPKITLIDNDNLLVTESNESKSFSSILDLLKHSDLSYQSILHNEKAMDYLLGLGCKKLNEIRKKIPNAGGLIVAASVEHAKVIQQMLIEKFQQTTELVTYRQENPLKIIDGYRHSTTQWIVSVGMISEGTDIPRLQVCCHLSAVKTELYFRQVLGRILRVNHNGNQEAWLYTFAESSLVKFSEQIEQDIPETCMFVKFNDLKGDSISTLDTSKPEIASRLEKLNISTVQWQTSEVKAALKHGRSDLISYESDLKLGQFKQRIIAAFT
ncbi:DEAD/DEAH box helicase [Vibrio litoralis]|uniref:DEAD/DEAH box helicase n=1 Tax=Vibrio litoralis TaxID=335972 RepID=UPI0018683340|nr:DEAD/DEAH box helicase family protein [Vibrio litoralis]